MQLRLVDYNYLFQSEVGLTASSADPEFPVSNLRSHLRSKVWRTTGTFVITVGTNDKINFKESGGGVELTATLTAGTYTPTTLAAEIKTQLEAVGAATYTVSFSTTTGKWTISTDGAFLSLLWSTGTNAGTSVGSSIGFDVSADSTGALTYTGANIAIHTEESVVIDLLSSQQIDSFALLFDPISGMNLSANAVVKLQANATNVWTAPSVNQTLSVDHDFDVVTYFFATAQTYRYWRILIQDPKNTDLYVELGAVVLGKGTQVTYLPSNEFGHTVVDLTKYEETEYGHRYGDLQPLRKKLELDFQGLPYADMKTLELAYRRNGRAIPVLIAFDPTAEFYDKDHFCLYGFFDGDFNPKHRISTYFQQGFTFVEAF